MMFSTAENDVFYGGLYQKTMFSAVSDNRKHLDLPDKSFIAANL